MTPEERALIAAGDACEVYEWNTDIIPDLAKIIRAAELRGRENGLREAAQFIYAEFGGVTGLQQAILGLLGSENADRSANI